MKSKQFWKIVKEQGWKVTNEGNGHYLLSQYSSYGQDFNVPIYGRRADDRIRSLDSYIDGFDVSYEASLWLDESGHGKNGAPYEMVDVYKNMEECKEMMEQLLSALEE